MSGRRGVDRHGKGGKRRVGVHKHHRSPEVVRWTQEHLPPERPPWMDEATYARLARLRLEL